MIALAATARATTQRQRFKPISLTPRSTNKTPSVVRVARVALFPRPQSTGAGNAAVVATGTTRGGGHHANHASRGCGKRWCRGPAVVRSGGINIVLPNNDLFGLSRRLPAHFLIETDPAFANYRTWLSSDCLLNALLALDPALTETFGRWFL